MLSNYSDTYASQSQTSTSQVKSFGTDTCLQRQIFYNEPALSNELSSVQLVQDSSTMSTAASAQWAQLSSQIKRDGHG